MEGGRRSVTLADNPENRDDLSITPVVSPAAGYLLSLAMASSDVATKFMVPRVLLSRMKSRRLLLFISVKSPMIARRIL